MTITDVQRTYSIFKPIINYVAKKLNPYFFKLQRRYGLDWAILIAGAIELILGWSILACSLPPFLAFRPLEFWYNFSGVVLLLIGGMFIIGGIETILVMWISNGENI